MHVPNELELTFHTRVIDTEACPVDIAIHWCQVIHIEINWCSTWTIASWLCFGEQTKMCCWFAFQVNRHYWFPPFLWSKFHFCSNWKTRAQSVPVSNLYIHANIRELAIDVYIFCHSQLQHFTWCKRESYPLREIKTMKLSNLIPITSYLQNIRIWLSQNSLVK